MDMYVYFLAHCLNTVRKMTYIYVIIQQVLMLCGA